MNSALIIIFFVVESILLGILGLVKKLTKKVFLIISVVTIILGCVALIHMNRKNTDNVSISQKDYIYIAGRLMEDGFFPESLNALAMVDDQGNDEFGIVPLRGLAYNENEAYQLAVAYLETVDDENSKAIYECSLANEKADEDLQKKVIGDSRDSLALSEEEIKNLDIKVKSMYPEQMGSDEESENVMNPNGLDNVKALIADNKNREAFEVMKMRAENDANEGIILAEMYVRGYDNRNLSDDDEAYDAILNEITEAQVEMINDRQKYDEDADYDDQPKENKDYYVSSASYSNALEELSAESIKRAINYLEGIDEARITDKCAYNLEMAYLYYRLHDEDSTKEFLDKLFTEIENGDKDASASNTYRACAIVEDAYSMYLGDSATSDFDAAYDQLFGVLYGNVFKDAYYSGFKTYLQEYLKDRIGGIQVSSIDKSRFPVIKATVYSTREDISIDESSLVAVDTGDRIDSISVIKEETDMLSICYVLDVSGSMSGSQIIEAKNSIRESVFSMEESTEVALVSFENDAKLECSLTVSKNVLVGKLDGLVADGGTSIASGLISGCEALSGAHGSRAIILLSDGYDGDADALKDALAKVQSEGIPVYTIGLSSGCDKEYLSKIANDTGGVYAQVDKVGYLSEVYADIKSYMQTKYIVTYTSAKEEPEYRYMTLGISDTPIKVRKTYNTLANETNTLSLYEQQADYFKEIGGTLSMGGGN